MTSGINWNSYTSTQIIQMYQMGIQVPSDVLTEAQSTADQNFETDDEVIREAADIELEEFLNSSEYSDAKLKDQVVMLGEVQEKKYKEAFEANEKSSDIGDSINTIETTINDRVASLESKIAELYTGNGEITDEMIQEYSKAATDINTLSAGIATRSGELKDLNEKAIVAETFAEKTGEQTTRFLNRRSAIRKTIGGLLGFGAAAALTPTGAGAAALIGGSTAGGMAAFDNLLKGEKVKNAEHILERSEHIVGESQNYEESATSTLGKMGLLAKKANETIKKYKEVKPQAGGNTTSTTSGNGSVDA